MSITRTPSYSLLVALLAVAFLETAQGASALNFPRLSFRADTIVGIAVVNPNETAAAGMLSAFRQDGSLVATPGFPNPRPVEIPAGEQFASTVRELFGAQVQEDTVAWLQLTSESDNLTGFFLILNTGVTLLDGADIPQADELIIFDQARLNQGFTTELNLVNPGDSAAAVRLTLQRHPLLPVQREMMIPARGALRLDAATFFDISDELNQASVLVDGQGQEILGFAFIQGQEDFFGLNARPLSRQLNRLFFPQLAVLDPFLTQLVLNNSSEDATFATVSARQPSGDLYGSDRLQQNPVTRVLLAGQVLAENLETMFGFSGEGPLDGWLEVGVAAESVNGFINYAIPSINSEAAVASLVRGTTRAVFSHIASTSGFFTGVALLNAARLAANVRIVAFRPDSSLLGSYSMILQPGQRISKLIEELIPQAANQAGGIILVVSDVPIFATSLFGSIESGVLANIPPQSVPAEFQPGQGLPTIRIQPAFGVLQPGGFIDFQVLNSSNGVNWQVNGEDGGNSLVGTITQQGSYTAPSLPPNTLPITISAESGDVATAVSVDVFSVQSLATGLGEILSVAYLDQLQQIFTAEFAVVGNSAAGSNIEPATPPTTVIYNVTDSQRTAVSQIAGESVRSMLPFLGVDERPYLLLFGELTGNISRLDVSNGEFSVVASGVMEPSLGTFDPATNDLLVLEQEEIRIIPRDQLNQGLTAIGSQGRHAELSPQQFGPNICCLSGIAVDPCTGKIYLSSGEFSLVREFDPATQEFRDFFTTSGPGRLLGLHRSGLSCPESFHLLVAQGDGISLIIPSQDLVTNWVQAADVTDLTFIPESEHGPAGVFFGQSIFVPEPPFVSGEISFVPTLNLYQLGPNNARAVSPAGAPASQKGAQRRVQ